MTEPLIHPTALISSVAELAPDVQIGPYSIIEAGTVLKEGVMIGPYVLIQKGTTLEARVRVSANAVIGGLPQVYHFDSNMASGVIIGEGTVIGEGVTIHRGTIPEGLKIGRAHV